MKMGEEGEEEESSFTQAPEWRSRKKSDQMKVNYCRQITSSINEHVFQII